MESELRDFQNNHIVDLNKNNIMVSTAPSPLGIANSDLKAPQKIRCSPLDNSVQQKRYQDVSQTKYYYFTNRSPLSCEDITKSKYCRAIYAQKVIPKSNYIEPTIATKNVIEPIDQEDIKNRQISIDFIFRHVLGCPDEENWHDLKVIPIIMNMLHRGSWNTVNSVLKKCVKMYNDELNVNYEQDKHLLLIRGSEEEKIILKNVMKKLPIVNCWEEVNLWRKGHGKTTVSWSTVQRFVNDHPNIVTSKRKN